MTIYNKFGVKVKVDGEWRTLANCRTAKAARRVYNEAPVPKMLVSNHGILHKQNKDNGFSFTAHIEECEDCPTHMYQEHDTAGFTGVPGSGAWFARNARRYEYAEQDITWGDA